MASNVLVSARVTRAKKDASRKVLAALGATTSDLINSAFDYVIETGKLPTSAHSSKPSARDFAHFVAESSLAIDWMAGASSGAGAQAAANGDYRALIREEKRAAYESLA